MIIKDLGKKTKKYKRIQYGCMKTMKGGGPIFQPLTDVVNNAENIATDTYNTFYGIDRNTDNIY